MRLPAAKLVYQPGIHRAEHKLSALCFFSRALNIFEYPFYLSCREIRVYNKSRLATNHICVSRRFERVTHMSRSSALPYYGVAYRLSRGSIPNYNRFSLICDTDSVYLRWRYIRLLHSLASHIYLRKIYIVWIMLNPTIIWEYLRKFLLGYRHYVVFLIKNYTARACCALVKRENIIFHFRLPFRNLVDS